MKLNVKISKPKQPSSSLSFPAIGIVPVNGLTVLFTSSGKGVVLDKGRSIYGFGTYGTQWSMNAFEFPACTVTLNQTA